jgi:mono/diheme cytochrome c family protein
MRGRVIRIGLYLCAGVSFAFVGLTAGAAGVPGGENARASQGRGAEPAPDQASIDRGEQVLGVRCGFCHGSNARGGSSGPDLLRSPMVLDDENGKELGEFLKVGRPDKGMPKFDLTPAELTDLAAFLHAHVATAINRGAYKILVILTGDAKAGEAYFNGAGRCTTCHSATGDLKGIGSKYDAVALQGRMIMPPRGRGGPGGRGAGSSAPPITVTVTPPGGEPVTGVLMRLTDFDVTLRDASGQSRSWLRNGDIPKVVVTDPLKGHVDMLMKWTDGDMHNVTAYLVTLK